MTGASIAHYLPMGTEVVFLEPVTQMVQFGTIARYSGFERTVTYGVTDGNRSFLGVSHKDRNGHSAWTVIDAVTILKLNPTPKEKMLYMLKGLG